MVNWGRFHRPSVEVSSKGVKQYSAFYARLKDGETIEYKYQCRIKGYSSVKEGKGNPPKDTSVDLWEEYLKLWLKWSQENPELVEELYQLAKENGYTLTDMFATTPVNQARALATILNQKYFNIGV